MFCRFVVMVICIYFQINGNRISVTKFSACFLECNRLKTKQSNTKRQTKCFKTKFSQSGKSSILNKFRAVKKISRKDENNFK